MDINFSAVLNCYVPAAFWITTPPTHFGQTHPYYRVPGSFRNYLVYPRPVLSVNVPGGVVRTEGKMLHLPEAPAGIDAWNLAIEFIHTNGYVLK